MESDNRAYRFGIRNTNGAMVLLAETQGRFVLTTRMAIGKTTTPENLKKMKEHAIRGVRSLLF